MSVATDPSAAPEADRFDVIVVGGGSAGAVVAARLSEDPSVRVALVEAGGTPPAREVMPAAVASLQLDPDVDWMYTGDPGGAGKGLTDGRMMVPRGKMLGGSSGLNYMAYVRGHPGDFDGWAADGAKGWSYDDVLPYFLKSEDLAPPDPPEGVVIDEDAHAMGGPLGVSVRAPRTVAAEQFVEAAEAIGIPMGDYNGRDRGGPVGCASLFQTTTRNGMRSSTYHAFLEPVMERDNLTVITHAQVELILLEQDGGGLRATGVRYRDADGQVMSIHADREVVVSAGAIGSPQLLLLSGIGPSEELASVGVECVLDNPHVGKHLKDHLHVPLAFPAPGVALTMTEIAISLGPDALRAPAGPLPADPGQDDGLPPELAALKAEAERRVTEWATTGQGLASSSFYDAVAFFSTGLGDPHTHDAQIGMLACGYTPDIWKHLFRIDPEHYFADPAALSADAETVVVLPNPVQPHSEGQVSLVSNDVADAPRIDLNYFADPHDVSVMVAVMRRALEIVDHWPGDGLGPLMVPPALAQTHGHTPGEAPSDALLEDLARHYALTVYHETSTCRMGSVVDSELRVFGVAGLRVADASVMPTVVSGNTNAATIMIGERAAEMIAADHQITLASTVGRRAALGVILGE